MIDALVQDDSTDVRQLMRTLESDAKEVGLLSTFAAHSISVPL